MRKLGEVLGNLEELTYDSDSNWILPKSIVGIELEVENIRKTPQSRPHDNNAPFIIKGMWRCVSDGSLRNHGAEFVSAKLFGKDLTTGLNVLSEYLAKVEPKHTFSHRTSVHIHLDVRDMTMETLSNIFQLYCMVERPLFRYSGGREHNEYCIPLYHSQAAREAFSMMFNRDGMLYRHLSDPKAEGAAREEINATYIKYMGLNILPISTYGSIEFRHHKGTSNIAEISRWINMIYSLKKAALLWEHGIDPYLYLSEVGPIHVVQTIFPTTYQYLMYDNIIEDMWEGARVAQEVALFTDITASNARLYTSETLNSIMKYTGAEKAEPAPKKKEPQLEPLDMNFEAPPYREAIARAQEAMARTRANAERGLDEWQIQPLGALPRGEQAEQLRIYADQLRQVRNPPRYNLNAWMDEMFREEPIPAAERNEQEGE